MACVTVGHTPLSLRLDPLPRQETRGLVLLPEIGEDLWKCSMHVERALDSRLEQLLGS